MIKEYSCSFTYEEANRVLAACRIAIDEHKKSADSYEKKGMPTSAAVERVYMDELETIMRKVQTAVAEGGW